MKYWSIVKWKIAFISISELLYLCQCDQQQCTKENQLYHDAKDPDKVCLLGCKSGCYCRPGYMLDSDTDECIHESSPYARQCEENEYLGCGEYTCENNCGLHRDPICGASRFDCGYRCFCKPGFIKCLREDCIPIEECATYFIVDMD